MHLLRVSLQSTDVVRSSLIAFIREDRDHLVPTWRLALRSTALFLDYPLHHFDAQIQRFHLDIPWFSLNYCETESKEFSFLLKFYTPNIYFIWLNSDLQNTLQVWFKKQNEKRLSKQITSISTAWINLLEKNWWEKHL